MVAIHGVIAAADRGDPSDACLLAVPLDLADVVEAAERPGVAPVGQQVEPHPRLAQPTAELETGIEMLDESVHAGVRCDSDQVDGATAAAGGLYRLGEDPVGEERAVADRLGDPHRLLVDDPARAEVLVPHLAVAHGARRQAHVLAAGLDQGPGIGGEETVRTGSRRQLDGVEGAVLRMGIPSPTVAHDENHRAGGDDLAACQIPPATPEVATSPASGRLSGGVEDSLPGLTLWIQSAGAAPCEL